MESTGAPVKAWIRGVDVDANARQQIRNIAQLPIVHGWIAVMPDAHLGKGATVGTVIPSVDAIIPAAVGVDLGCGMMATRTSLTASDLPDSLARIRSAIEAAVPHGRTHGGGPNDRGAFSKVPETSASLWRQLGPRFDRLADRHPKLKRANHVTHLGTLGTGNHFIELCLDEEASVWVMLHSGSRGVGHRIGSYFIERAREEMRTHLRDLPDRDLAYLREGTTSFDDYVEAVDWAQEFALRNRELMMKAVLRTLKKTKQLPRFDVDLVAVNCHHNYVSREHHGGRDLWVTRKGAVRARRGELGIIPGSMGARSFIVRGKGNPDSFESCSHGAGRRMSRGEAKRRFTLADHRAATEGVECRKDKDVLDETPNAYKDIDRVMAAQSDLVDVVHTLKQIVCVKG
jgi:tRNA-splicing ligase RtcB